MDSFARYDLKTHNIELKSSNVTQAKIISDLRTENTKLKSGDSDLERKTSKLETDISLL